MFVVFLETFLQALQAVYWPRSSNSKSDLMLVVCAPGGLHVHPRPLCKSAAVFTG